MTASTSPLDTRAAAVPLAELRRTARSYALNPNLSALLPESGGRTWARLAGDARLDVWLISWPEGTETGWHDHGEASGAFTPDDERRRDRVDALALVDVDEVDPGRRHGDAHLTRARRRDVAVLHGEDVGAAVPGDDQSGDGERGGGHGGQPRRVT